MAATLLKLALTPAGKAACVALALGAVFGAGYWKGKASGRVEALQGTIEAYKAREGIDHEISGWDRVRLCIELGGLRDECEQLRGMEAGEP